MKTKEKIDYNSFENQDIKGKFVAREVLACFSYEMDEILKAESHGAELPTFEDIENLYEYRCPDCGDGFNPDDYASIPEEGTGESQYKCPCCNKVYESIEDLEYEPQEIFEWWIVTEYLYEKLKDKGEPLLTWGTNYYWGRTCTGQAILLDWVISQICEEMQILDGQPNSWNK